MQLSFSSASRVPVAFEIASAGVEFVWALAGGAGESDIPIPIITINNDREKQLFIGPSFSAFRLPFFGTTSLSQPADFHDVKMRMPETAWTGSFFP
jgi:hypothetical protein